MALTAAERQALYRERRDADPARRVPYLKKEKEAWARRKAEGRAKQIDSLPKKEQKKKRNYWKKAQRRSRSERAAVTDAITVTPPHTPEGEPVPAPISRCVFLHDLSYCNKLIQFFYVRAFPDFECPKNY